MRLVEVRQTCSASPAQWEGRTDDGRPVYIRYRWGYLSVQCGAVGGDIDSAVVGDEVYGEQCGDEYDGVIEWDDVCRRAGIEFS